jgi:hypothetical protein
MRHSLLVLAVLTTGCSQYATQGAMRRSAAPNQMEVEPAGSGAQNVPRQLIRRGGVEVTVEKVGDARLRLERAIAALNGQVARLDLEQDRRANYQIRVPPDRLEALMDSAAALGKVGSRTISAEDVTDRVVDSEARLSVLRASRDRLKQLIERSASVSDIVTVERELSRVQSELESLEARLNALKGSVALSELSVRIDRQVVLGPVALLFQGIGAVVEKLFIWRR